MIRLDVPRLVLYAAVGLEIWALWYFGILDHAERVGERIGTWIARRLSGG